MEKISNCPNNTFDCGTMCGLSIGFRACLKILEKVKDTDEAITIFKKFTAVIHEQISEKHLEHMNGRYQWEKILDDLLKKS